MELNKIYNEDCIDTLKRIDDNSIDVIVTSPPYNKGLHPRKGHAGAWSAYVSKIEYESYSDDLPQEQYNKWQSDVLIECLRVLKPSGSIFYNHKEGMANGRSIFPKFVYDFSVHQTIVWDRGSGPNNDPHQYQNRVEFLFWIVKDAKVTYFDKSKSAFRQNVWRINFDLNTEHPAPFPLLLAENCVATCCPSGGVVYDPFMGSGTTAIASLKQGANFIGSEISQKYIDIANKRIDAHRSQLTLF